MIKWITAIFLFVISITSYLAEDPLDIWLTKNQQAVLNYKLGDYEKAARLFNDTDDRAYAYYSAGLFNQALSYWTESDHPLKHFYLGNAHAHNDQLELAIDNYKTALSTKSNMEEAIFNLNWVEGLYEVDNIQVEDVGGTGGKLGADKIVFDDKAQDAVGETTKAELKSQGLSDKEIEELWMKRVETTPGDFLAFKFSYQLGEDQ